MPQAGYMTVFFPFFSILIFFASFSLDGEHLSRLFAWLFSRWALKCIVQFLWATSNQAFSKILETWGRAAWKLINFLNKSSLLIHKQILSSFRQTNTENFSLKLANQETFHQPAWLTSACWIQIILWASCINKKIFAWKKTVLPYDLCLRSRV